MDYRDYYLDAYRDYYRDPFPHALLSTRESPLSLCLSVPPLSVSLCLCLALSPTQGL